MDENNGFDFSTLFGFLLPLFQFFVTIIEALAAWMEVTGGLGNGDSNWGI
jgi:hypothetical protein